MTFPVMRHNHGSFLVAQILDTLLGTPMKFYPYSFAVRIDEAIGVRAESVHVSIGSRDASVGHNNGDLMKCFGKHRPEVPIGLWRTEIGLRIPFHSSVEVRELERIADKEHGCVVAHQIPIAFFGIKLYGKASDVAFGISGSPFSRYSGETYEYIRLFSNLGEKFGTRVFRDVFGYGEVSEGSTTFGMHSSFRNDFAIEMCQFLDEPYIFQ